MSNPKILRECNKHERKYLDNDVSRICEICGKKKT